jgi:hypothetical protein
LFLLSQITPPQTQRNSLAPPGGFADIVNGSNRSDHDRPSDASFSISEVRGEVTLLDNEVTNSQRSSVTSSSETPPDDRSNQNSRRSGQVPQREGSLGSVQVRVKKRRRFSGERQSEVSLNVEEKFTKFSGEPRDARKIW